MFARPRLFLWLLASRATALAAPSHLVVLQHGLSGTRADLAVLAEMLERDPAVLAHLAHACEGRTVDGVAAGGARLADETRAVIARHGSLRTISFVGNSLGGIYMRWAIAALYRASDGTVGGLRPRCAMTLAAPHLGIRRFTYLPLPSALHALAPLLVGQTGEDLFFGDANDDTAVPLLMRMAEDTYLDALRAFERRVLLANTVGDFMVPFGTAAIDATFESRPGFASAPAHARRPGLPARIAFDLPAVHADTAPACDAQSSAASFEQRAAAALNALGWRKVGVRFETVSILPLAHNKLCALTRTGLRRIFAFVERNDEGRSVMEYASAIILEA